jgi:hypothetical protein
VTKRNNKQKTENNTVIRINEEKQKGMWKKEINRLGKCKLLYIFL